MSSLTPSINVGRTSAYVEHTVVDITTLENSTVSGWNTSTGNDAPFITREAGGFRCAKAGTIRFRTCLDYGSATARKTLRILPTVTGVVQDEERSIGYARVSGGSNNAAPGFGTEVQVSANDLVSVNIAVISGAGGTATNITKFTMRAEYVA